MTFSLANDIQEGDKVYNNVQRFCRLVQIHTTSSYKFFLPFFLLFIYFLFKHLATLPYKFSGRFFSGKYILQYFPTRLKAFVNDSLFLRRFKRG